jgi:hypothetical protein
MLSWTFSGKMGGLKGGPAKPKGSGKSAQPSAVSVASASAVVQDNEVFRIL